MYESLPISPHKANPQAMVRHFRPPQLRADRLHAHAMKSVYVVFETQKQAEEIFLARFVTRLPVPRSH
jgi:hypothetical protein